MSKLGAFNKLLQTFITYLTREFQDLKDIRVVQTSVELLIQMNPRKVQEQFMFFLFPFWDQIYSREESFFKDPGNLTKHPYFNGQGDIIGTQLIEESEFSKKFSKLLCVWESANAQQRERIWKFLQALLKLGAIASKNPEHQTKL
jgi:hypothetical protein